MHISEEALMDREMAYSHQHHTDYSCGDLHSNFMECRRVQHHNGPHASGYGAERVMW